MNKHNEHFTIGNTQQKKVNLNKLRKLWKNEGKLKT